MRTMPDPIELEAYDARRNCLEDSERRILAAGGTLLSAFATDAEVRAWAFAGGLCTLAGFDANPNPYRHAYQRAVRAQNPPRRYPLSGRTGIR